MQSPTPRGMVNPDPEKLRAARAWAKAYNSFDTADLEALLDGNVRYPSMWVWEERTGRKKYLKYLHGQLKAIRNSNSPVIAEIAETRRYPMYQLHEEPCVYARQESLDEIGEVVVLFSIENGLITQIAKTGIPDPPTVYRTGEIPR